MTPETAVNLLIAVMYLIFGGVALFATFATIRTVCTRRPVPMNKRLGGVHPYLFPGDLFLVLHWFDGRGRKIGKAAVFFVIAVIFGVLWGLLLWASRYAAVTGPVTWLLWGSASDDTVEYSHYALMLVLAMIVAMRAVRKANRFKHADGSWYYNDGSSTNDD